MFLLFYLVPIGIQILIFPVHFLENTGLLIECEALFGVIIVPIYLSIVNAEASKKCGTERCFRMLVRMWIVLIVTNFIPYLGWGISSNLLFSINEFIIELFLIQLAISFIIATIGWGMAKAKN